MRPIPLISLMCSLSRNILVLFHLIHAQSRGFALPVHHTLVHLELEVVINRDIGSVGVIAHITSVDLLDTIIGVSHIHVHVHIHIHIHRRTIDRTLTLAYLVHLVHLIKQSLVLRNPVYTVPCTICISTIKVLRNSYILLILVRVVCTLIIDSVPVLVFLMGELHLIKDFVTEATLVVYVDLLGNRISRSKVVRSEGDDSRNLLTRH
mmetsp:Transcript_11826/g.12173  ORF Transcript_11826/g.12173 Transcript_11826/m.12173 type:complete len:207 (+) Transcript_11826:1068-1688(+)